MVKSVLIICDKDPFGTNSANEAIRISSGLIGLGAGVKSQVILMGDGVMFMSKNLKPEVIGMDNLAEGLEMAELTDLSIIVVQEDMDQRGLQKDDLINYSKLEIMKMEDLSRIASEFDVIFRI